MRVLVCPDKFKGSLTAIEVCNAIELGLKSVNQGIEVIKLPLADGGEGTLDLLEGFLNLEREYVTVHDPLFRTISTYYLKKNNTAYIEMAKASGLQLLEEGERNPLQTTTFGTGELIANALDHGVTEIYLLIGGSATNEGGIGMASALGFEFLTGDKEMFLANGEGLNRLTTINAGDTHSRLSEVKFTVLSDVKNILTGPNGASRVYGGQKGADASTTLALEGGLENLARLLDNGMEDIPGAGAAGGLGYGALSFLDAEIESGIEAIMRMVGFEEYLKDVDLIITGEGKLDDQTAEGKVISGVARMAKNNNIPMGIICGIQESHSPAIDSKWVYQINDLAKDLEDSMTNAFDLVSQRAEELAIEFWEAKP